MKANNTPHYSDPRIQEMKYNLGTSCYIGWAGRGESKNGLKIFFYYQERRESWNNFFTIKKWLLHSLSVFL